MHQLYKFLSVSLMVGMFSSAVHSATLNIDGGILLGASDVEVDGAFYDVEFKEGTCAEIFNGCDDNADFTFSHPTNNGTLLSLAMQALLEQVFVDSPQGAFDTNPALTNGCTLAVQCIASTPLFISGGSGLGITSAVNRDVVENGQVQFQDHLTAGGGQRGYDTTNGNQFNPAAEGIVYARWSGAAAVPIPAAIWLFACGLFSLFGLPTLLAPTNRKAL